MNNKWSGIITNKQKQKKKVQREPALFQWGADSRLPLFGSQPTHPRYKTPVTFLWTSYNCYTLAITRSAESVNPSLKECKPPFRIWSRQSFGFSFSSDFIYSRICSGSSYLHKELVVTCFNSVWVALPILLKKPVSERFSFTLRGLKTETLNPSDWKRVILSSRSLQSSVNVIFKAV